MNADGNLERFQRLHGETSFFSDDLRQRAAVGIAQDDHLRTGLGRGSNRFGSVRGIGRRTVEEVLGIVEDVTPLAAQELDGFENHVQVFFVRDAQNLGHMKIPGLPHNGNRRPPAAEDCFQQGLHAGVILGGHSLSSCHAEGADCAVFQIQLPHLLKVLRILRIAQRVATLHIVHANLVQPGRNLQLVLEGEAHAFSLRAVTEGGVVDLDAAHVFWAGWKPTPLC